jgi:transcriptional regulator with XRE-family HTH domain
MSRTFREAFLEALSKSDLKVPDVARISGVSKDQLNKLKQRENAKTNVEDARKIAAAFGQTIEAFIDNPSLKEELEIAELLSQLEPGVRKALIAGVAAQVDALNQASKEPQEE